MSIPQLLKTSYRKIETDDKFEDFLLSQLPDKEITVIGIEGGSSSGKTTFTAQLVNYFTKEKSAHILLDDYVHLTKEQMAAQKIETRYDWRSRDRQKIISDLEQLRLGNTIEKPTQDYALEKPSDKTETVESKPYIFVEGNLDITDLCDFTIFMFAPDDIMIKRRLERDKDKVIYDNDDRDKLEEWFRQSLEYYHEFLEPTAGKTDIIIDNHNNNLFKKI